MPGHYNKNKGPRFLGAGLGGYRGDIIYPETAEDVARKYTKGYVGGTAWDFSHMAIPTWEDRNSANNGTKLNP